MTTGLRSGVPLSLPSGADGSMIIIPEGEWARLNKMLLVGPKSLRKAINLAVKKEAEDSAEAVKKGLRSGAPGGKPLKRLSPGTLLLRPKGVTSKPLLPLGRQMLRAIKAFPVEGTTHNGSQKKPSWHVGINPNSLQQGQAKKPLLAKVAARQEKGFHVLITPNMRLAFFYKLRAAKKGGVRIKASNSPGAGFMVVRIPPRPFFAPVLNQRKGPMKRRLKSRIMWEFGIRAL